MPGLNTVHGEADATHRDLKHAGRVVPFTVWGEEGQEYESCSLPALQTRKKAPELRILPPTDAEMILHIIV